MKMQREEIIITPASSLSPYLRELAAMPPPKVLLYGRDALHATATRFVARAALHNTPVLVVDGANAFDPYEVAQTAQRRQRDPERLLKSIRLARAFTCYQLRELIFRLPEHLEAPGTLVTIIGLCTTFFDDDVMLREAAALFYQTWWKLAELNHQGVPILIAQSVSPVNLRRKYFLEDLYRLSDWVLRVEPAARPHQREFQPMALIADARHWNTRALMEREG
ncbi:MAG: hypothetical protein HY314_06065 [Acidobacteria bacterium]|nr:hypothetical protein [Acidobacteriota bacterium]